MRRWVASVVVLGLIAHALLSCGAPPTPSGVVPRVFFTGEAPVTVVADGDGRAVIVSETAGVEFDLRAANEAGNAVGGAQIEYHEDEDGFAHILITDDSGAFSRGLGIVKLSDLTGLTPGTIQPQAVVTAVVIITFTVVSLVSVAKSYWKGHLATQDVRAILSTDLIACDGQNPAARCLCKTPAEIAGLYHDLSARSDSTESIARTAFWRLTGGVANAEVAGEALAIGAEAIGFVTDVADLFEIGSFLFADGAAQLGLDEPYFSGMASGEPMKVVLLDYRGRTPSTPFGETSSWSGVVLTGESCVAGDDDVGVSHQLSVALDPVSPNAHQDLYVEARLAPAAEGLPVSLTTIKLESGDPATWFMEFLDPLSIEDPWIAHGVTDEFGVVRFHVPGSRVAPGDEFRYSVASAATSVARIGTYGMVAGTVNEVSPWAKLWAPTGKTSASTRTCSPSATTATSASS